MNYIAQRKLSSFSHPFHFSRESAASSDKPDHYGSTLTNHNVEHNDQCNVNLVPTLNVGTGYTIRFINPVNISDIYAESEQFEVKPKGSPYPTIPTPSVPNGGGSGASNTAAGASASATHDSAGFAQTSLTLGGALALVGSVVVFLGA
jgi:hypothetical protein